MKTETDTGLWGENQAVAFLKKQGYAIKGRRIKVGDRDEIDILAMDGCVLVFVEVKTRKSEKYGRPLTAVDRTKRHNSSRAAVRYLKKIGKPPVSFRFDVVEVIGSIEDGEPIVRLIRNAFQLDKCYRIP